MSRDFRVAYSPPASELPGAKTFVHPKSEKNLPTDTDREKERVLPPGSATPSSPKKQDGDKSKNTDRSFQDTGYNSEVTMKDKHRTKSQPGEQYGTPYKNDYHYPTRRTMTSYTLFDHLYDSEEEGDVREAGLKSRFPKKRQRAQRGRSKLKSRTWYRRNRSKHKTKAKRRYRRLKNRPAFKRDRKMRRKYPSRFKRRRGMVLTAPEIKFVIGREQVTGTVHGVSPMTGMVNFATEDGRWVALPLVYFLSSVAFLSEADIDAMFELIDVEVGLEAYEDIGPDEIEGEAELFCVNWEDNAEFQDKCVKLTGQKTLDEMSSEQLEVVSDALLSGDFGGIGDILEGGGREKRDYDDQADDPGDAFEIDPADDRLYYGEVETAEDLAEAAGQASPRRIASRFLREFSHVAQDILLIERDNSSSPGTQDESPYTPSINWDNDDKKKNPPKNDIPESVSPSNPPSQRVMPGGEGGFVKVEKSAAKLRDLVSNTSPEVHNRSKGMPVKLVRAMPDRGIWLFNVKGRTSTYRVRIKGEMKGNVRKLSSAQVKVSCSCPYWRWQGPEHWGKGNDYLYGRPRGTASVPVIMDPKSEHWACKHVLATIRLARNYSFLRRRSGEGEHHSLSDLRDVLESAGLLEKDMISRLANRYLNSDGG